MKLNHIKDSAREICAGSPDEKIRSEIENPS